MVSEEAASLKVSLLQMNETLLGRALNKCTDNVDRGVPMPICAGSGERV